jgi:DinB superfamily
LSTISVDELMRVTERVFVKRETTLEEEAAGMSLANLKDTVRATRRMLIDTAKSLPDAAYERQADDLDGNDVWSAGEIASHIAGTTIWTDANLRKINGLEALPPTSEITQFAEVEVRSKSESLRALDVAEMELERILDGIADDLDTSRTIDLDTFGTVGVKGWLLLTALHEGDHANQLRELRR